jgi:hypothetical protein
MGNFWDTTEGESATSNGGSFDAGGGAMEPIPGKTQCLAAIDEVSWDVMGEFSDDQGEDYIKVRWSVLAPAEYKNRKVFQKVRVLSTDSKKSDKAKRMLAAIDANAGGKLSKVNDLPTDEQLIKALCNKPMVIMLQLWEMKGDSGEIRSGNWVSAVSPRAAQGAAKVLDPDPEPAPAKKTKPPTNFDNFDDDVPF